MQITFATEAIAVEQQAVAVCAPADSQQPELIDAHLLQQVCGAGKLVDAPGNGW